MKCLIGLLIAAMLPTVPSWAGEPPAPPTAVSVAPAPPPPDAEALKAKVAAADQLLHQLAQNLGVPTQSALPPTFWDTTAGKVVQWTIYALGTLSGLAVTAISLYETLR